MKYLILLSLLISVTANAETGVWTGKFTKLESEKPNVSLWACEYQLKHRLSLQVREDFCPFELEIK